MSAPFVHPSRVAKLSGADGASAIWGKGAEQRSVSPRRYSTAVRPRGDSIRGTDANDAVPPKRESSVERGREMDRLPGLERGIKRGLDREEELFRLAERCELAKKQRFWAKKRNLNGTQRASAAAEERAQRTERTRMAAEAVLPREISAATVERAIEKASACVHPVLSAMALQPGELQVSKIRRLLAKVRPTPLDSSAGTFRKRVEIRPAHPAIALGLVSKVLWLWFHEVSGRGSAWDLFERYATGQSRPGDPLPRAVHVPSGDSNDHGVEWDTTKFAIETLYGLQHVPEDNNDNLDLSGVAGFLVRPSGVSTVALGEGETLKNGDRILLKRYPSGPHTPENPWVPFRFRKEWLAFGTQQRLPRGKALEEEEEDEESRLLSAFVETSAVGNYETTNSGNRWVPRPALVQEEEGGLVRAEEDETTHRSGFPTNRWCPSCGAEGDHDEKDCPAAADALHVPLYAKKPLHGVPLNEVRMVRDPRDVGRAPYYRNGRFYRRLNE